MRLEPKYIKPFIVAGNATFTLRYEGGQYTFRIKKRGIVWYISYKGQETVYIGFMKEINGILTFFFKRDGDHGFTAEDPQMQAFFYLMQFIQFDTWDLMEVWHEGSCGKCGRQLTDPKSIEMGIGPTCRKEY